MSAKLKSPDRKVIASNKKARFNYAVEETLEAGLQLQGSEVKSLRAGNANLADAYAIPKREELFLVNCRIGPYEAAAQLGHEPTRARKLLLHKKEIERLVGKVSERGYSLVPLSLYFKNGFAKVELGLCRGKTHEDRREDIKERETRREIDRAVKGSRRGR
ncbi:MAG TPA: SsrA-binding protein SmpB [Myxococcales bacterium]|nr:SsrA-binding protein SmpB [Myxococcales bacterium]